MKKIQLISCSVLLITVLVIGINKFIFSLPDWVIRINGIIMLIGIFSASYSSVKCLKKNK